MWSQIGFVASAVVWVLLAALAPPARIRWIAWTLAVAWVLIAAGSVLESIRVDAAGLLTRRPLRHSRRIRWAEIRRFENRGYWRGLGVWLADGRWVRLYSAAKNKADQARLPQMVGTRRC